MPTPPYDRAEQLRPTRMTRTRSESSPLCIDMKRPGSHTYDKGIYSMRGENDIGREYNGNINDIDFRSRERNI